MYALRTAETKTLGKVAMILHARTLPSIEQREALTERGYFRHGFSRQRWIYLNYKLAGEFYLEENRFIFVVRFLFEIPPNAKYSSWHAEQSIPGSGDQVSMLWPLAKAKNGQLILTATPGPSSGFPYDATEDFQIFSSHFKRRDDKNH